MRQRRSKPLVFRLQQIQDAFLDLFRQAIVRFSSAVLVHQTSSSLFTKGLNKRLICRVLKPRIRPASFWRICFLDNLCITSKRFSSFVLIASSLSISCPFAGDILTLAKGDISTLG